MDERHELNIAEGIFLQCPRCNDQMINHGTIDIYDRTEDAPQGDHTRVEGNTLIRDGKMDGNPSDRRYGLTVRFACEGCGCNSLLNIAQHKGATEIYFTFDPSEIPDSEFY